MDAKIASIPCDRKRALLDVSFASTTCSVSVVETIGQRITRLRNAKGWSRPELGRQMAEAIKREKPFSGELIRLYEEDTNKPGDDARLALAKVFDRPEVYLEFGAMTEATRLEQPAAAYGLSKEALEVAKGFDLLSPDCQEHVQRQVELLRMADTSNGRRAAQHDAEIKGGKLQPQSNKNRRKGVR